MVVKKNGWMGPNLTAISGKGREECWGGLVGGAQNIVRRWRKVIAGTRRGFEMVVKRLW